MNLKRIKAAIAELSACVDEMEEGSEEKPEMAADDDEDDDAPAGAADSLKMKLMKFKTA